MEIVGKKQFHQETSQNERDRQKGSANKNPVGLTSSFTPPQQGPRESRDGRRACGALRGIPRERILPLRRSQESMCNGNCGRKHPREEETRVSFPRERPC